ncbi:hypothetical protein [Microbacterium deminutum]
MLHARVVYRPRRTTEVSPLIAKGAPADAVAPAPEPAPEADVGPDAPVR